MKTAAVLAGAVLSLVMSAMAAFADDCTPRRIAQLDMIDEPDGRLAVAVGLAGAQHRMLIATTDAHTQLFEGAAQAAGLHKLHLSELQSFDLFGGHASGYASVDSLTIGGLRGGNVSVLITPGPYRGDADVVGILASDLLGNFDLDLDFANHKVNLFAANPCEDKRVYWAAQYSQLAMDGPEGRIVTTMMLDGKPVEVALDSLAVAMRLRFDVANRLFGLNATSPGVTPIAGRDGDTRAYRYPFAALSAAGIQIDHPNIVLVGDPDALPCNGSTHPRVGNLPDTFSSVTCWGGGDLTFGIHRLRTMHLYYAYKARKIYFTDAAAH